MKKKKNDCQLASAAKLDHLFFVLLQLIASFFPGSQQLLLTEIFTGKALSAGGTGAEQRIRERQFLVHAVPEFLLPLTVADVTSFGSLRLANGFMVLPCPRSPQHIDRDTANLQR